MPMIIEKAEMITLCRLKPSLIVTFGTDENIKALQGAGAEIVTDSQTEHLGVSDSQAKFDKWMSDNLPNNRVIHLSSGSYLIDIEMDSDDYKMICDHYEDGNGHPKAYDIVLWTITQQQALKLLGNLWSNWRGEWDLEFDPKWGKCSTLYISDTKQASTKESMTVGSYRDAMLYIAEYGVPNKIYYENDDKYYASDFFADVKDFKWWLKEAHSQGLIAISDKALKRQWNRIGFDLVVYNGEKYSLRQIKHSHYSYDTDDNYISSPLYEIIKKNNLAQYFDICGFDIALTHLDLNCEWEIDGEKLYLLSLESKRSMVHSIDQLLGEAKPEFSPQYMEIEKQKQILVADFEEKYGSLKEMEDYETQHGLDNALSKKYEAYTQLKIQLMKLDKNQSYCDKKRVPAEWFNGSITLRNSMTNIVEIEIVNGVVTSVREWIEMLIDRKK